MPIRIPPVSSRDDAKVSFLGKIIFYKSPKFFYWCRSSKTSCLMSSKGSSFEILEGMYYLSPKSCKFKVFRILTSAMFLPNSSCFAVRKVVEAA